METLILLHRVEVACRERLVLLTCEEGGAVCRWSEYYFCTMKKGLQLDSGECCTVVLCIRRRYFSPVESVVALYNWVGTFGIGK